MKHALIKSVAPGSIASEMGLSAGDCIIKINGTPILDILDYKYLIANDEITVEVLKANGDIEVIYVETGYEDLGIEFESFLADAPKRCKNKCIFCFIDQLPKGMRRTMYFKDDDERLSFLQGNYITLTNLSEADIERLINLRISPINVSVHTTNPALRVKMLNNPRAGSVYEVMRKLTQNKIMLNCQIVLCRDINDKAELDRTICDLAGLHPYVNSVSVVPVGLTAYRENLYPLTLYDRQSAKEVIVQVERWQREFLKRYGSRIVYAADEFYILADCPIPPEESYEGFPQIENGVGLIASMRAEFERAMATLKKSGKPRRVSVITGEIAYPFIRELCDKLSEYQKGFLAKVYAIKNNFFGGGVTVSGLICGCDIIEQLQGEELGEEAFIPSCMLKKGEDVFLDDVTLAELQNALNTKITPIDNNGYEFVYKLLKIDTE